MLKLARLRPVRGIRCARVVPRQGACIVFSAVEIVRLEDGALEGAGRGVLCRWRGWCSSCADGRMDGRVGCDCYYCGVGGWEEKEEW